MRSPAFWRHDGILSRLLLPASCLYAVLARMNRTKSAPKRISVPVICIGNLVAGGAGKTPTALYVGSELKRMGHNPHFLTRGYGGRSRGPLRVETTRHDAREVGDEPLLLAKQAPAWVARDRVAGAEAAVGAGADCIVMDDGFQNFALEKDLSLVVVDADYGFGNGFLMPAGPLREPIETGLSRADGIILIESALQALTEDSASQNEPSPSPPVLKARLLPGQDGERLRERRIFAFAGIGRPEKFFDTLTALGANVVEARSFADHHDYEPSDIMEMVEAAHGHEALLMTTAKDFVRLPEEAQAMVSFLPVTLVPEQPGLMADMLGRVFEDG